MKEPSIIVELRPVKRKNGPTKFYSPTPKGYVITQAQLKEFLDYNPETGIFIWKKVLSNRIDVGGIAGCRGPQYFHIMILGRLYVAHRLAWLFMTGSFPVLLIDHINGDGFDNRFCNLRESNYAQNGHNVGTNKSNTSGYKGVYWSKQNKKWQVNIKCQNKNFRVGQFSDVKDAARAYNEAALRLHGAFAKINSNV